MAGEALRRLERLEDDAGVAAFWAAFRPGQLVCAQCGVEAPPDAKGWELHLRNDPNEPEAFAFCPECAKRAFGNGKS